MDDSDAGPGQAARGNTRFIKQDMTCIRKNGIRAVSF